MIKGFKKQAALPPVWPLLNLYFDAMWPYYTATGLYRGAKEGDYAGMVPEALFAVPIATQGGRVLKAFGDGMQGKGVQPFFKAITADKLARKELKQAAKGGTKLTQQQIDAIYNKHGGKDLIRAGQKPGTTFARRMGSFIKAPNLGKTLSGAGTKWRKFMRPLAKSFVGRHPFALAIGSMFGIPAIQSLFGNKENKQPQLQQQYSYTNGYNNLGQPGGIYLSRPGGIQ